MFKRTASVIAMVTLIVSMSVGSVAMAAPRETSEPQMKVQEAIEIAKSYYNIPNEMDELHTNYYESEERSGWELIWHSSKEGVGELIIGVDANSKEIIEYKSYRSYDYEDDSEYSYIPKLSWEEGERLALAEISRLWKLSESDLYVHPMEEYDVRLGKGTKYYYYDFSQSVNGISYHGNRIDITLNADTGEVRRLSKEWKENLEFPQSINVSVEEAQTSFSESNGVRLHYVRLYNKDRDEYVMKLVYVPVNAGEFALDAETGELVEQCRYEQYEYNVTSEQKVMMDVDGYGLAPYEEDEVELIEGLLSREEAQAHAEELIEVADGFQLERVSLQRDYSDKSKLMWSLRYKWEEEREGNLGVNVPYTMGRMSITIDAETGALLRYSKYIYNDEKHSSDVVLTLENRKQAQELAESFLAEYHPDLLVQLELEEYDQLPSQEKVKTYNFNYSRLVNDALFGRNGVHITVDAVAGEVIDFSLQWNEYDFMDTSGVIPTQTAITLCLEQNPLVLEYKMYKDEKGQDRIYLVYVMQRNYPYVDAFTGEALQYDGTVGVTSPIAYEDIEGHWAEKDIQLLRYYGLLPFNDSIFEPNKEITQGEFVEILRRIRERDNDFPGPIVVERFAKNNGLVLSDVGEWKYDELLNRENMAQILANFMGYREVATLNIYKLGFADSAAVSMDRKGAVAICSGMGLISGIGNNFQPSTIATRAQVASTITRFLKYKPQ